VLAEKSPKIGVLLDQELDRHQSKAVRRSRNALYHGEARALRALGR
jgi:hypothetical protein